ncbi:MAG: SPFH domain-containing protein [Candidatus Hermodarchaeota archaeon]
MDDNIPEGIQRTQISKLAKGKKEVKIAEMIHESSTDLSEKRVVYRLSFAGNNELEKYSVFVVKGYETAILIQLGQFAGIIPEGIWKIDKKFLYSGTEIIWIDKTEFKTRWGLTDIYLKDNIKIGAHGSLLLKIKDPKNFVLNIVSSKQVVEKDQVDDFIYELVTQSYNEVLGEFTIDDVIRNRQNVKNLVSEKLNGFLKHWGIELINLEVEGFKLPEEFDKIGEIEMVSKVQKLEKIKERDLLKEDIETSKLRKELKAIKKEQEGNEQTSIKIIINEEGNERNGKIDIEPPFEAYKGEEPFLFVSYTHKDMKTVYPIIKLLYKNGINIWYDEGIPLSSDWSDSLAEKIMNCNVFLSFISPQVLESESTQDEIQFALNEKKTFLAIYLEETDLSPGLKMRMRRIQGIQKYEMDEERFYKKLIEEVNRLLPS